MKETGGRIVNISSTSGKSGGSWSGAHYVASKAGLIGLARYCAGEWAKYGILSNAIYPHFDRTNLLYSFSLKDPGHARVFYN